MICVVVHFLLSCMYKNKVKKNAETDLNPLWQTMIGNTRFRGE